MNFYHTHFDELWDVLAGKSMLDFHGREIVPAERKSSVCTMPNFPHSNVFLSEDTNELTMEFALAGYEEEEVSVTADNNTISVAVNPKDKTPDAIHVHHGISRKKVNFSLNVDKSFDARKAVTSFSNGILRLRMNKAKESQAIKLM